MASLLHHVPSTSMAFLRPLAAPRPSTMHRFLRLSSSAKLSQEVSVSPSSSAAPSSPSPSSRSSSSSTSSSPTVPPGQTYFVHRTASKNLPVYLDTKRGGNMRLTIIRKLEGNVAELKRQLETELGLDPALLAVNSLTRQVVIKGWHRESVTKFLEDRHF